MFPNTWPAIGTTENQYINIVLKDGKNIELKVPKGTYLSPKEIENNLQAGIIRELESELLKSEDGVETASKRMRRNVKPLEGEVIRSNTRVQEDLKYTKQSKSSPTTHKTIEKERVETGFRTYNSNKFDQDKELPPPKIIGTAPRETIVVPSTEPIKDDKKKNLTEQTPVTVYRKTDRLEENTEFQKKKARLSTLSSIFLPDYEDLYLRIINNPFDDKLLFELFEEKAKRKGNLKNKKKFDEILPLATAVKFEYAEDISRFMLRINDVRIKHVILSSQICYVLGFEEGKPLKNLDVARYSPDLRGGCSHICVYIGGGLLEQMIVGDKLASLLQIVAVTGKPGDIIEKKYDSPLFNKVIAREIQEIEVELRTLEGRLIPFDYGTVICTLIFRKTIVF